MENIYQEFIEWRKAQPEGYIDKSPMTGGEVKFIEYFLEMTEKDPKLKSMIMEVGTKLSSFKQIHTFYKDQRNKK